MGGGRTSPTTPSRLVSRRYVRIPPRKGKGKSDGWFPQPWLGTWTLTHNTRRVCTKDPETKLPMHSLCPTREWERELYGVTTPNIVSGWGGDSFSFWGNTPPYWGGRGSGCGRAHGGL